MKASFLCLAGLILLAIASGCSSTGMAAPTPSATPVPSPTSIPATATPEPTPDPVSACFGNARPVFTNYAAWTKVNPKPIDGHETKVNIYVDDLSRDIYLSASGETFPPCATIVKTHLLVAADGSETVTALTVMVKMPAGFNPEHNDWWWGMYDASGKNPEMSGKVEVCIACHQPQAAADYVFSKKVLEESTK